MRGILSLNSLCLSSLTISDPDSILLRWTDQEYTLFRALEQARYGEIVARGFSSVDDFVVMANQVLNRRKSRAGKSLEHHLAAIFDENKIRYTAQAVTEGNKKPDFLFPSEEAYHTAYPKEKRDRIWTLGRFVGYVKEMEGLI